MVQAWSPTSSTMRFTSPQSCRHFNCHVATVLSLPTSLVAASSICCVKPDHLLDASLSGERRWRRHTQPSRSTDAWQRDARRKRSNRRREWNPKVARSLLQRDAAPRTRQHVQCLHVFAGIDISNCGCAFPQPISSPCHASNLCSLHALLCHIRTTTPVGTSPYTHRLHWQHPTDFGKPSHLRSSYTSHSSSSRAPSSTWLLAAS